MIQVGELARESKCNTFARLFFFILSRSAALKNPQKPQECREIVVYLHRRNETSLRL